jgi:hypothetical protein
VSADGAIVKDLSHLLEGRSKDNIIVVDCKDHIIDEDVSNFDLGVRYDG